MSRYLIYLSIAAILVLYPAAPSFAISDGSSSSPDMPPRSGFINLEEERGRSIVITAGFDHLFERNIENYENADSGEMEGDYLLLGFSYRINNLYEPYLRFGVSKLDIAWRQNGSAIGMEGEYEYAVGAGFKMLAYKTKVTSLSDLKVDFDGQVRYTSPSIDNIVIDGLDRTRSVSASEFSVLEGRATVTLSLEISLKNLILDEEDEDEMLTDILFAPYLGLGFMDSITTAKFDLSGMTYGFDETPQEYNFGGIAGIDFIAPDYAIVNLEGQIFGNDKSASGGVNIKF